MAVLSNRKEIGEIGQHHRGERGFIFLKKVSYLFMKLYQSYKYQNDCSRVP